MKISTEIENIIQTTIHELLNKSREAPEPGKIIETDNLAEVIEKLAILHCRMWYLEDACGEAKSEKEYASLKRKLDICFKDKRPKYIEAINEMFNQAVLNNKSLREESVKHYTGFNDIETNR